MPSKLGGISRQDLLGKDKTQKSLMKQVRDTRQDPSTVAVAEACKGEKGWIENVKDFYYVV